MFRKALIAALVGAVILLVTGGCPLDSAAESEKIGSVVVSTAADVRPINPLRCDLPKQFGYPCAE